MLFSATQSLPAKGWYFGQWNDLVHEVDVLIYLPNEKQYVIKRGENLELISDRDLFADEESACRQAFERFVEKSSAAMERAQRFRNQYIEAGKQKSLKEVKTD